jgi:hypothetical protein
MPTMDDGRGTATEGSAVAEAATPAGANPALEPAPGLVGEVLEVEAARRERRQWRHDWVP